MPSGTSRARWARRAPGDAASAARAWFTGGGARRAAADGAQLVLGSGLVAMALAALIIPNRLGDGGWTGLSVLLHYLTGWSIAWLYPLLNVPVLAFGLVFIGLRFTLRTLAGIALTSAFLPLFVPFAIHLDDPLLASVYSGVVLGAGIGILLRAGSSSGGSDILARFLADWRGIGYTATYLAVDAVVLASLAFWVGVQTALYAWIVTFLSGRLAEFIVSGTHRGKVAMIVTGHPKRVLSRVMPELGRGATVIEATGGFTAAPRTVVWVVVSLPQLYRLRHAVAESDPQAFVAVMDAAEVLGHGFGPFPSPRRRLRRSAPEPLYRRTS